MSEVIQSDQDSGRIKTHITGELEGTKDAYPGETKPHGSDVRAVFN